MRVVIIADGSGSRWGNHLGVPKHLVEVDGESIIHRAQRLFAAAGAEVLVVASDARYATEHGRLVGANHDYARWLDGDKFASSAHHWHPKDRTIVVYGDVYFTEQAVQTITTHEGRDWTLFGRFGPSSSTGSKHAEIFALSFHPNHHAEMMSALEHVSDLARRRVIDRCGGWELYRAMNGLRESECRHRSPQPQLSRSVVIDDWTEDFDTPADYEMFTARRTPDPVTVAVPLGEMDDRRLAAWQYIQARWAREYPSWPVVTGFCDGAWRKAVAIKNAVDQAETPHVLVIDADLWIPGIDRVAVELKTARWAKPHRMMIRLTPQATLDVLAGENISAAASNPHNQLEPPYSHVIGGGAVMLPTEIARECPGDARFVGWGGEDAAWGWMLQTILGPPLIGLTPAIHLWHPPQDRPTREHGSPANEALKARYSSVRGDKTAMLALIEEGRATSGGFGLHEQDRGAGLPHQSVSGG